MLFEFKRTPFGLCQAPSTLRLMEREEEAVLMKVKGSRIQEEPQGRESSREEHGSMTHGEQR